MMEKTFPLVIQVSSGVELMVGEGPISSACALSGMAIPAASSAKAMAEATSNTPSLFLLKTILLLVEGRDACRPALQSSSGPSCAPLGGDASARWPISSHLWHISERRQGGLTHRGYAGDLARRPPPPQRHRTTPRDGRTRSRRRAAPPPPAGLGSALPDRPGGRP